MPQQSRRPVRPSVAAPCRPARRLLHSVPPDARRLCRSTPPSPIRADSLFAVAPEPVALDQSRLPLLPFFFALDQIWIEPAPSALPLPLPTPMTMARSPPAGAAPPRVLGLGRRRRDTQVGPLSGRPDGSVHQRRQGEV